MDTAVAAVDFLLVVVVVVVDGDDGDGVPVVGVAAAVAAAAEVVTKSMGARYQHSYQCWIHAMQH